MYLSIEDRSFNEKIRFVERNLATIDALKPEVRIEILCNYVTALFEMHKYVLIPECAQNLLELIIENNIIAIGDKNVFQEILYLKGMAHLHLDKIDSSRHIFTELLKMKPEDPRFHKAIFLLNRKDNHDNRQKTWAICIALFLSTGIILAVELLFVRVFYEPYSGYVEALRITTFLSGVGILLMYKAKELYRDYHSIAKESK